MYIFLRKSRAHELTPKGRRWELANGSLKLRFPDAAAMDKVEFEDGALVLDWVVKEKNFAIALLDNGTEEMGSVLSTLTFCVDFIFLHSGLDLPKLDSRSNKSVRESIRTDLTRGLSGYEIDDICDIDKPGDVTVAEKAFHQNNFQSAKHSLVVKLRPRKPKPNHPVEPKPNHPLKPKPNHPVEPKPNDTLSEFDRNKRQQRCRCM